MPFDPTVEYGLGAIPSPFDIDDYTAELDTGLVLPKRFLLKGIPPVMNQGNSPKCGGYSGAGIKTVQERKDGHGWLRFDPDWLYSRAQERDGISMPHVGTNARGVCKALQKVGGRVVGKPGSEKLYRIAGYNAIPFAYDSIKRSIFQFQSPVLIGAQWYNSWFRPFKGVIPAPDYKAGGHLFWAWAWDDNVHGGSLICQNSWGRYAGSVNGRFYAPKQYLIPAIHDAWRLYDINT